MCSFYSLHLSHSSGGVGNSIIVSSGGGNEYTADARALLLVQDLMSAQALLSLLAQSSTLLVRGQTALGQFPRPGRLPEGYYYLVALLLLVLHAGVLFVRAALRAAAADHSIDGGSGGYDAHSYVRLDWFVWALMFLLPLGGVLLGMRVNKDDDHHYRRYLQFLRLEFDTRLGMHSPR